LFLLSLLQALKMIISFYSWLSAALKKQLAC